MYDDKFETKETNFWPNLKLKNWTRNVRLIEDKHNLVSSTKLLIFPVKEGSK